MSTAKDPADMGTTNCKNKSSELWWRGPDSLAKDEDEWPNSFEKPAEELELRHVGRVKTAERCNCTRLTELIDFVVAQIILLTFWTLSLPMRGYFTRAIIKRAEKGQKVHAFEEIPLSFGKVIVCGGRLGQCCTSSYFYFF